MSKKIGDLETITVRAIAEYTTKSFLVKYTTKYALKELDEQDIKAIGRIWEKVNSCARDIEDSLRETPDIEVEREDEYYD